MRGICKYASDLKDCCDIYAYQTEPGGLFVPDLYWDKLECDADRVRNRSAEWISSRTSYCDAFWSCYTTPSSVSIVSGSLMNVDLEHLDVPYIWWICSMIVSVLFAVSLTVFSKIARKRKRYRDFSILTILIPALRFLGIVSILQLVFFLCVNFRKMGLTRSRDINCCDASGSLIFVLWSSLQVIDTLLPVLFLLQRNFTVISFVKSGLEAACISAPIAIIWGVFHFHDFSGVSEHSVRSIMRFLIMSVNIYLVLLVCYVLIRLWKSRHVVRMKPHIWSYALVCMFLELYSSIFLTYVILTDLSLYAHTHTHTHTHEQIDTLHRSTPQTLENIMIYFFSLNGLMDLLIFGMPCEYHFCTTYIVRRPCFGDLVLLIPHRPPPPHR